MERLWPELVLVLACGCGRFGFDPPCTSNASCIDACTTTVCDPVPDDATPDSDAGLDGMTDGMPTAPSGTYSLMTPINYTCASGLVAVTVSKFTFADDATLVITSDDPGSPAQPCVMTGPSVANGNFDVTCTLAGGCDETYRLAGSFTDADSWMGTFTATFTGMCLNCTMQSFVATGTR